MTDVDKLIKRLESDRAECSDFEAAAASLRQQQQEIERLRGALENLDSVVRSSMTHKTKCQTLLNLITTALHPLCGCRGALPTGETCQACGRYNDLEYQA